MLVRLSKRLNLGAQPPLSAQASVLPMSPRASGKPNPPPRPLPHLAREFVAASAYLVGSGRVASSVLRREAVTVETFRQHYKLARDLVVYEQQTAKRRTRIAVFQTLAAAWGIFAAVKLAGQITSVGGALFDAVPILAAFWFGRLYHYGTKHGPVMEYLSQPFAILYKPLILAAKITLAVGTLAGTMFFADAFAVCLGGALIFSFLLRSWELKKEPEFVFCLHQGDAWKDLLPLARAYVGACDYMEWVVSQYRGRGLNPESEAFRRAMRFLMLADISLEGIYSGANRFGELRYFVFELDADLAATTLSDLAKWLNEVAKINPAEFCAPSVRSLTRYHPETPN